MKPNLFIVGAPKCGTTALAAWLAEHPQVFMSATKEPHHFSTDYQLMPSREAYEALFAGATSADRYRCEASVWSMYSPTAVPNMLAYAPDARFIAMVRNPVEIAPSTHRQQCFNSNELVTDFDKALDLNDARLTGSTTGVASGYPPDHLAYFHSCALGWQLKRLLDRVPKQQLHVVIYDDLKADPRRVYDKVLEFLDVSPFAPSEFRRINVAKERRFVALDRAVRALGHLKARSGIRVRFGVLAALRKWNRKRAENVEIGPALRQRLVDGFRRDIDELQVLLGRDLSHWTR